MLEAVQQPVGVGGIVARLELPEPDEPRHAGVDRLFEQMLKVAPKPGRNPLGDAGFDPAFRVDQRVGADPLDRRRRRQDGSRVTAGLDKPAHQVLVRLRPWRFFAEPVPELMRRAAREGPESVQAAQFAKMLVSGLGPHRVVGEASTATAASTGHPVTSRSRLTVVEEHTDNGACKTVGSPPPQVARTGNPVLRRRAPPLDADEIVAPAIQRLIDVVFKTMSEYVGVRLAARSRRRPAADRHDQPGGRAHRHDRRGELGRARARAIDTGRRSR